MEDALVKGGRQHGWRVGVVVPARNEAARIAACLDSIERAAAMAAPKIDRLQVLVVADSCRDATAAIASRHDGVRVREVEFATAGAARACGAADVVADLGGPLDRIWLANTDADSTVSPDWLDRQLVSAASGAAAVAGIVTLAGAEPRLRESFRRMYSKGIAETTHPHVHATNFGLRAEVLEAVGGWSAMATGEDHDLWERLRASGAPCISDPNLVVSTSARRTGRAPLGFSTVVAGLAAAISGVS